MTISAVIIAMNAEQDIKRCLESVTWCDEIIVLDSGSQDNTINICRQYTDKVFETDWPGYGQQKARAIAKATSDWVLSIDSDEWLSEQLIVEIKETIQSHYYAAYSLLRRSNFCGRFIRYGQWGNDRVIRLFQNGKGQYDDATVHESIAIDGKVGQLKHLIWHNAMPTLDIALDKMNRYTSLSAQMKRQQGRCGGLGKALLHGLWAFMRCYFLKLGLLDGAQGFVLAVNVAEISYYRYLKIRYDN